MLELAQQLWYVATRQSGEMASQVIEIHVHLVGGSIKHDTVRIIDQQSPLTLIVAHPTVWRDGVTTDIHPPSFREYTYVIRSINPPSHKSTVHLLGSM